ncbi:cytochrome o ubiquinol oxidase subunit IV [Legionella qingyii]|uniref:Cytochrome bo(3) ubiquinol oxidase subunit 4 n=1 Tax=Legionella qingyii TaxID=2184757 RepID=A0A317U1I2_9GAMM|nr:cytochrome o ubiquinol oxidase subunit IV [Legionella qingyii]PWY55893.1 cytochrome o ubiquinol oxidase subunit IV [Legionella qingyii]RUR22469.1 cytochrome o ubiquinol oxidase subunit IV [Legionella qingyii]RUR27941.1 cytochrome o ubiquinol oxidase subunit IV [Legionella qingyii]
MSKHELILDADTGASYGTYQSYTIGFVASLLLTLFSFYLVASSALPPKILYIAVGVLAIIQLFVQLVFFLHLNTNSKTSWNLLSFLFTLVVVLVLVIGTMWIMYNLYEKMDMNMMAM